MRAEAIMQIKLPSAYHQNSIKTAIIHYAYNMWEMTA
jgi:hypothetical protein